MRARRVGPGWSIAKVEESDSFHDQTRPELRPDVPDEKTEEAVAVEREHERGDTGAKAGP